MRSFIVFAAVLSAASSAAAFSNGQYGYSGKSNSCQQCHGATEYQGIDVKFDAANTYGCTTQAGETLSLPFLKYGESMKVTLTVKKPEGADAPVCPTEACDVAACSEASGRCRELYNVNQGQCPFTLTTCGAPLGGFNASIDGVGTFESLDDSTRVLVGGSVMNPDGTTTPIRDGSEITHRLARQLADTDAVWEFTYKAPEKGLGPVSLFVGANVANGNGWADTDDRNTNLVYGVALLDEATNTVQLPPFCAACEGQAMPDANGQCPACACTALPSTSGVAGVAVVGLLALLSRRRRR